MHRAVSIAAAAPALLLVLVTAAAARMSTPAIDTCNAAQSAGICYQFSQVQKGNQFACKLLRGRYLASAGCPTVGALGTCSVKDYVLHYYPPTGPQARVQFNKKTAEADCLSASSPFHAKTAGTWKAAP